MAESIIKVKRREGFTILPNSTLRDNRLSLKTRAILAIMISVPEDWDFTVSGLAVICGTGRDAVRSSLRELEACGYLTRVQRHNDAGHFSRNEYIVADEPAELEENTGEGETPLSGYPSTGDPLTDEPLTGNPTQQNKDYNNTPYSPPGGASAAGPVVGANAPMTVPREERRQGRKRSRHDPDLTLFDRFWAAYPKKRAKDRALRAWRRLNPDLALCQIMSAALERDKASRDWQKDGGAYIPYPATWLNGRRWEDEDAGPVLNDDGAVRPEGGRWL